MANFYDVNAAIDKPNLWGSYQQGMQFGQQQRALKEQRTDNNALRGLAPQIIAGDPKAYDQAAAINPEQAGQYQKAGDSQLRRLSGLIKLIEDAEKSGNPRMVEAAYQQGRPYLSRVSPNGVEPPATFEEARPMFEQAKARIAMLGPEPQGNVQSTYVDAQGNRVGVMRDGTTQILGQNAPNNQIIDTGQGFYGVNKGNLQAAPVMVGGQPQAAPSPQPPAMQQVQYATNDGSQIPPEDYAAVQAVMQAQSQGRDLTVPAGGLPPMQQAPQQPPAPMGGQLPPPLDPVNGGQLFSAPKPTAAPSGYRVLPDGSMAPIPGGPAQVAMDARADAAAAKKAAEDVKSEQKRQAATARQTEAATAANQLVSAIDGLIQHPGFGSLGTAWGDAQINVPLVRNDAKDAKARLENIGGQVALSTMARLKSLSSTGATGFGSLTAPELKLLQNSIDTLQSESISNEQLASSLTNIRNFMDKTATWTPASGERNQPTETQSAQSGRYQVGQVIEANGKRYRVTGGDLSDPDVEEVP